MSFETILARSLCFVTLRVRETFICRYGWKKQMKISVLQGALLQVAYLCDGAEQIISHHGELKRFLVLGQIMQLKIRFVTNGAEITIRFIANEA
jgi:EamA domain-containing membrane protein RarD